MTDRALRGETALLLPAVNDWQTDTTHTSFSLAALFWQADISSLINIYIFPFKSQRRKRCQGQRRGPMMLRMKYNDLKKGSLLLLLSNK